MARGPQRPGRDARWGRRRNAEGSARRGDRGAPVRATPRNLGSGRGGAGARPARARAGDAHGVPASVSAGGWGVRTWPTRGPAGGQSAGRAVPGRGRWHLRPMRARRGRHLGQSPGDPSAAAQWLGAGRTTCRAGRAPPAANGSARGPALPGNRSRRGRPGDTGTARGAPPARPARRPLREVGSGAAVPG